MIVVFLQNPWSPFYAGRKWPRDRWLLALANSHSGKRLARLGNDLYFTNTTPIAGSTPDSVVEPDIEHIIYELKAASYVVTCGKQAELSVLPLWDGPALILPHPAYRVVTNKLFDRAKELIDERSNKTIKLRQLRGQIEELTL